VLSEVDENDGTVSEEVFGPVPTVRSTRDLDDTFRLVRRITAGGARLNCRLVQAAARVRRATA
jgi:acyl-CoA reductase-like NAD-dependent aldehyde dehydrogenase